MQQRPSRGVATVLILLLVGMSLTVSVLGTAYYIRSSQAQSLSTHAQTQAQLKAWTGAEIVQQYLKQLQNDSKLSTLLSKPLPITLTLTGTGVTDAISASITAVDTAAQTLTVHVGGVTAAGTRAEANSLLELIYSMEGGTSTAPAACTAKPRASTVFKGDVSITGGTTSITSVTGYSDIAVDGSLTISNASQAIISGCTKGDINLSGGGIDANATMSSENGTITINSMSQPTDATLWGKNVAIGNTGSGSFIALKAGAYATRVTSQSIVIGTANIGGQLLPSTAGPGLPWTTGTVVPWGLQSQVPVTTRTSGTPTATQKAPGSIYAPTVVVMGTNGTQWLLDLRKATINHSTGVVTGATAASELLSGSGTLSDTLEFTALSIFGGALDIYNLTVKELTWGHTMAMKGYGGTYGTVFSNGDFQVVTAAIDQFAGGGFAWATAGGCSSPTNCWNFPTVTSGKTAGSLFYSASKTPLTGSYGGLLAQQTNTSPGLPGTPFCDTRVETVDIDSFKSQSNYVFEFINGIPQVTVQNVKRASGVSIDGVYSLKTPTTAQRAVLNELMVCNYGNIQGCLQSGTTWALEGVTRFPSGIAWFDRDVTIHGTQVDLLNTVASKGSVTLTTSGHKDLVAPNFSTPAKVCDGTFYPANLCNKGVTPTAFTTWVDADGVTHTGLPLANMALLTGDNLSSQGWTVYGNISLGGQLSSGANATQINGNITVGANRTSSTTITQGGMRVDTTRLTPDQGYQPGGNCSTAPTAAVRLQWARYL